jgi:Spy/CpxP family protein refolding chaperone
MASRIAWLLAAALACPGTVSAASLTCEHDQAAGQKPDQRPGGEKTGEKPGQKNEHRQAWWKAPETKAELGISDKQSKEIDEIFQSTYPTLRASKDELDKFDLIVAATIKEGMADNTTVTLQVGQAEQARAKLATARTMMLYRMHRLLSPEQRTKLNAMLERREAERRKAKDRNSDRR